MAKDPAFLFYPGDFTTGTQFFTDDEVGIYVRLLCAQHQHGRLNKKQFDFICRIDNDLIKSKFLIDVDGLFYNERLETESDKRKAFSESRRNNRNKLNNQSLHIYFIKNPENGLIKIGSSVDVDRRLIELKKQYNSNLILLFVSEKCSQEKEKELHTIYKDKNHVNEWFNLTDSDLEYIKSNHIKLHMSNHMTNHMENRNENENENIDVNYIEVEEIKITDPMPILEIYSAALNGTQKENSNKAWRPLVEPWFLEHLGEAFNDNLHVKNSFKKYYISKLGFTPKQTRQPTFNLMKI